MRFKGLNYVTNKSRCHYENDVLTGSRCFYLFAGKKWFVFIVYTYQ